MAIRAAIPVDTGCVELRCSCHTKVNEIHVAGATQCELKQKEAGNTNQPRQLKLNGIKSKNYLAITHLAAMK